MNAKQAREFYQDYLNTIYVERKVDQIGRFYAQDVSVSPAPFGLPPGLPGVTAAIKAWMDAFTDIRFTLDGFVYDGEFIAARITMTGTHVGSFLGIPATGKQFKMIDHPHYRMRDGKVAEIFDVPDMLTLLQQLGALPAVGQAA
jgi:predicted ester cyclase